MWSKQNGATGPQEDRIWCSSGILDTRAYGPPLQGVAVNLMIQHQLPSLLHVTLKFEFPGGSLCDLAWSCTQLCDQGVACPIVGGPKGRGTVSPKKEGR